jgi:hypothetical protein
MTADLKMLRLSFLAGAGIVGILAGEMPPGMAADPAGAFSCSVVNAVHGI